MLARPTRAKIMTLRAIPLNPTELESSPVAKAAITPVA